METFESKETAVDRARKLTERKREKTFKEPEIALSSVQRIGEDYRKGKDISSQELADTFGFRGINFGNWMQAKSKAGERQTHINHTYDSFMDLANILGIPPQAISLGGTLGIAYGAQGKKWQGGRSLCTRSQRNQPDT